MGLDVFVFSLNYFPYTDFANGISVSFSESEFNAAPVKLFKNLLLKYIDNDRKKELQALYAAQLLAEELKHPKGTILVSLVNHLLYPLLCPKFKLI